MTYADGTDMKVGDSVLIEQGKTPATITLIVESIEDRKESNVNDAGVLLQSSVLGLAFLPASTFSTDPIVFVGRGKSAKIELR